MKKMKRLFLAFLCAAMVAASGCSQTAQPDTPTEDTVSSEAAQQDETNLRLYLVRHGQTYSNVKEICIASSGSAPLTQAGRLNAYYAGQGLAQENLSFLATYCSPLNRTYETASYLLAGLGAEMPITVQDQIGDIVWGDMELGYPEDFEALTGLDPKDYANLCGNANDADFVSPVPGAETTYEFVQRFEEGLQSIVDDHKGETGNILVASHSTIGFYATKFTGEDPYGVPNTSVTIVDYKDGEFTLVEAGITSYMEDGQACYEALKDLEIYLVTTPQTLMQEHDLVEGAIYTRLVDAGVAAAERLPSVIGDTPVAIYNSSLGRSREALQYAYPDMGAITVEDDNLNELFLGYWEAERVENLQANEAEDYAKLISSNQILTLAARDGGGEAPAVAAQRLSTVIDEIATKYQASEGKVVVFTHPYILKAYLNTQFPEYEVPLSSASQALKLSYKNEVFTIEDMVEV